MGSWKEWWLDHFGACDLEGVLDEKLANTSETAKGGN